MSQIPNYRPSNSTWLTEDPVALTHLMSETLFKTEEETQEEMEGATAETVALEANEPVVAIETATIYNTAPTPEPQPLSFYGKNTSNLLFLYDQANGPDNHALTATEMEAFGKILTALKLSFDDIALVNWDFQQPSAALLLSTFEPQKIVVLGTQINSQSLGFTITEPTLHHVQQFQNIPFLHSYSFAEMLDDVEKKRVFWGSLKALMQP